VKAVVALLAVAVVGLGVFLLISMRRPQAPAHAAPVATAPTEPAPPPEAPTPAPPPTVAPAAPPPAPVPTAPFATPAAKRALETKGIGIQMEALHKELEQQQEVLDRQQRGEGVDPKAVQEANWRIPKIHEQIRHLRGEMNR